MNEITTGLIQLNANSLCIQSLLFFSWQKFSILFLQLPRDSIFNIIGAFLNLFNFNLGDTPEIFLFGEKKLLEKREIVAKLNQLPKLQADSKIEEKKRSDKFWQAWPLPPDDDDEDF